MTVRRLSPWLLMLPWLPLAVVVPAAADWLVTRDGSQIETAGAWEVKGPVVIFTSPQGSLSSLRLADVDLAASAAATTAAGQPPAPTTQTAAAEPREPVLRLTDRDVRRGAPPPGPAPDEPEDRSTDPASDFAPAAGSSDNVRVVSWGHRRSDSLDDGFDGIEITGTVQNLGAAGVTDLGVEVSLVDGEGNEMASGEAFLDVRSLAARSTAFFKAVFPEVEDFAGVPRFTVRSRELRIEFAPAAGDGQR